ncbi:cysteine hydrolase family protein [Reyranella sp. CPCC 100927]|uniref:cysteine hydrolase family protein n=1 Tax=Reyranella sp. CPCC 100927 TaxID=2599616 RepID=UPI0011B5E582|nr:cysteine hydrolase family protein [Reyranella sp. CPCC 100927]TWS99629.1 cysteine hydrolase [Reyranella sp. CPCC 100927]
MSRALVVIDVQQGMFTVRPPLHRGDEIVDRIAGLLRRARAAAMPVFHVQHDGGPGDLLAKGTPGFAHHPAVAPQPGEPVIEKRHSSAFHDTGFHAQLQARGIDHLIVAGLQTEMCVDSACRHAVALGYRVTLVADAHSTYDSAVLPAQSIIDHHNQTLGSGFVALRDTADVSFSEP